MAVKTKEEAMFESVDWSAILPIVQVVLIFGLPIFIEFAKKKVTSLDGPAAYWLTMGLQLAIGLLAALTENDPALIMGGFTSGAAGVGVYETIKRLGLATGSRERGER